MDRYELDRAAKIHGYEERDNDPPCSECIHNAMCSGKNCHFDRKWEPEDLEKKYYHVNDWEDRLSSELYSMRDRAEQFADWPSDCEGPYFTEQNEWRSMHPRRNYRVRLTIDVNVDARDNIEAHALACAKIGVGDKDLAKYSDDVNMTRMAEVETLYQFRMPVRYNCCEEGYSWGYEYIHATCKEEAQYLFRRKWIPDIESDPDFDDIEMYDDAIDEWQGV